MKFVVDLMKCYILNENRCKGISKLAVFSTSPRKITPVQENTLRNVHFWGFQTGYSTRFRCADKRINKLSNPITSR